MSANSYDKQFNTPLTYNYNLTLEREVIQGWMARVAYVGSKTDGGHNTITFNPEIYTAGATTATTDARRLLQPYGALQTYVQQRWSDYNAMQLTLNRRFSKGRHIRHRRQGRVLRAEHVLLGYGLEQECTLQRRQERSVPGGVLQHLQPGKFRQPATTVNSASFGRITSTHANQGDPRIIQFGLKFVF